MSRRAEGNLELRPMMANDVQSALGIISDYDEEDAEEAQDSYARGLGGQYCLCENGAVIGVVGGKHIPDPDANRSRKGQMNHRYPECVCPRLHQ